MSAFNYSANENRLVVVKHWAFKGYQALSLITPPVVLGLAAFRRGRTFTVNQLLRTTYISNSAGAAVGGLAAYGRLLDASDESLLSRRLRIEYDAKQRLTDDYSMIGSVFGSTLTTLIFWNRAPIPSLILGGAGLGSAGGILVRLLRGVAAGDAGRQASQ